MEPCDRCAVQDCKGVAIPGSTIHLCDLCMEKHAELICDCRKEFVYMNGQCGMCWVETQRKIHGPKKRRDTVAKMHSQPPEPKQPRIEPQVVVVDISETCEYEGCANPAYKEVVSRKHMYGKDHCDASDILDEQLKKPIVPITLADMFPDIHHLLREYARRFPVSMKAGFPPMEELNKVKCKYVGCDQAMQGSSDYCLGHEEEQDHDRLEQLAYVAEANKPKKSV